MKLRSEISLELVRQGFVSGSVEFKKAYNKEWAKRNAEKKKKTWRRYYKKKMIETHGEWNSSRIKNWRTSNPGDWKNIAQRASKNGIHKRFYANNKSKVLREKIEYGKRKRRENPFFGIKKLINSRSYENLRAAIKKLGTIIDGFN